MMLVLVTSGSMAARRRMAATKGAVLSLLVDAYQRRLVPTATDLESLAQESYRAGRISLLGVLDAQRSLRDLRRDALQAMLDLQLSIADLEELLGTAIQ